MQYDGRRWRCLAAGWSVAEFFQDFTGMIRTYLKVGRTGGAVGSILAVDPTPQPPPPHCSHIVAWQHALTGAERPPPPNPFQGCNTWENHGFGREDFGYQ